QPFVYPRLPDELRAHDVDGRLRQTQAVARVEDVGVGQIGGQGRVVVLDDGAEQQRLPAVDQQLQPGEIAGVPMVDAFGTALGGNDVAVVVEHREGVAVLERARPPILQRSGCRYVEPD